MTSKVETKVTAATLGAAVSGVIMWALSTYAFKGGAVPAGLVSLIDLAIPALITLAAGYFAPHTPRPATPAVSPGVPPRVVPPAEGSS